jgi:hypothetical protein
MCTALVIRKARPAKRPPLIGPGRLPAWQASLVVLGLLAPSSRSPLYQVKGGEAVAILAPYRLVPHHSALPAVRLLTSSAAASSLTNRAGCCGTVSSACPGPYPHLLVYVAVPNAWADADRRQPLRAQWARSLVLMDTRLKEEGVAGPPPATVLHFVIGLQGLSDKDKAAVGADSTTHQDLLILPDVTDKDAGEPVSRSSTTLKVMHSMAYAANHYTFDFNARVRDDAYLRIDYLAELILVDHAFPLERAYNGYKFANHHIAGSHSTHNFIVGMGFFSPRT